jgi:hypothetical protein
MQNWRFVADELENKKDDFDLLSKSPFCEQSHFGCTAYSDLLSLPAWLEEL